MSTNRFRPNDSSTRGRNWNSPSGNRDIENYQTENNRHGETGYFPNRPQQDGYESYQPASRFGSYEQEPYGQTNYRTEWDEQRISQFNQEPQSNWNAGRQQHGQQPYSGNQYNRYGQFAAGRNPQWDRPDRVYARNNEPIRSNDQFSTQGYTQGYTPGSQSWGGQYGQRIGTEAYGNNANWAQRNESTLSINERGILNNPYGPHKGKGPKGYQRSPERIKEDLNNLLMDDGIVDASGIEVDIENNNEVILSGTVTSREEKYRAEDLAESISGVGNVENRLHVNKESETSGRNTNTLANDNKSKRNAMAGSNI